MQYSTFRRSVCGGPTQTLFYTILYYTILYYTILCYTTLYYTILYYTILYYTILYYTILALVEAQGGLVDHAHGLLHRLGERAPDGHHLADGLHLGAERLLHGGELVDVL